LTCVLNVSVYSYMYFSLYLMVACMIYMYHRYRLKYGMTQNNIDIGKLLKVYKNQLELGY